MQARSRPRLRRPPRLHPTSRNGRRSSRAATAAARTARSSASGCTRRARRGLSSTFRTAGRASPPRPCAPEQDLYNTSAEAGPSGKGGILTSPTSPTPLRTSPPFSSRTAPVTCSSATPRGSTPRPHRPPQGVRPVRVWDWRSFGRSPTATVVVWRSSRPAAAEPVSRLTLVEATDAEDAEHPALTSRS